ncbi:hypothetical protein H9P43_009270 [Blastocladiella emersonii ATCC 22665]|nr:hypothetical protein H9P43_009270 [Blastocladiella emersonii ATCC 22665]
MNSSGLGATRGRPLPKVKGARGGVKGAKTRRERKAAKGIVVKATDGVQETCTGLDQFLSAPKLKVQPDLYGFVNRCLERYTDETEWDRAFAPLEHVDERIWDDFNAPLSKEEYNDAGWVLSKRGDATISSVMAKGGQHFLGMLPYLRVASYLQRNVVPECAGSPTDFHGVLHDAHAMFCAVLHYRLGTILRKHKVLRGTDTLAAARSTSAVTDTVLRIVAEHSQLPTSGKWNMFGKYEKATPQDLLKRAMQRVKLPSTFFDLYFTELLPTIPTEPASPGGKIPVNWVGEMLWSIFYDVAACEILALVDEVVAARGQCE